MSEPIRVLHILQRMEAAGVQTLLMNLYRKIDRNKVQFDFLVHYSAPQFFDEEIEKLGGRIYRMTVREDYNFIKYCKELDEFFRDHKEYRIVHGHMHSLGAIYLYYAKKHNVPTRIAHAHTNSTQKDFKQIPKLIMNKLYKKNATELFACSRDAGLYMFGDSQFSVINNAIISDAFIFDSIRRENKRNELAILPDTFTVGAVGRFELQKNQLFAVEVFKRIHEINSNSVLLLAGSGSMESKVRARVDELGIKNSVIFLGNIKDVADLYMSLDVFLLPSLFEGLGIVGVESQAAGTPTLCTDTLPDEINVTPLIYRLPLTAGVDEWAREAIEASQNSYAHTNMKKQIENSGYDMQKLSERIQNYYLERG